MDRFLCDLEERIGRAKGKEQDRLRRQYLIYHVIAQEISGPVTAGETEPNVSSIYDFDRACNVVEQLGGPGQRGGWYLGVKLPAHWNRPPVHHTEFNCWTCGTFAPGEKITGRDRAEGWINCADDAVEKNGVIRGTWPGEGVFCSDDCMNNYKPGATPAAKPARKRKGAK